MTLQFQRETFDGVQWKATQAALASEVERVVALLRSVRHPEAPAIGTWNLAETAMHLSQAWIAVPGLAAQDLSGVAPVLPDRVARHHGSLMGDVWELAEVTTSAVRGDGERNPAVLADRIEERASRYFAACAAHSPMESRAWLVEGVSVPLAVLTGHLLNETIMHGYDIARADGQRWSVDPSRAALVWDNFLVPVLRSLPPTAMVQQSAAKVRATFGIHIRGGSEYTWAFDRGTFAIEPLGSRRIDCHLSVDPAAFLLVAWDRMNQWKAISTGQFLAWGLKPWLGPRMRSYIRNP